LVVAGKEPTYLGDSRASGAVPDASQTGDTERGVGPAPEPPPERLARPQPPTFRVAGFWRRVAGALVDLAIVMPVGLLLSWIAGSIAGISLPASKHRGPDFWLDLLLTNDPALWGAIGLTSAIVVIYLLLFHVTLAQTPGMRLLKMRIIDMYGDPPSIARSVSRTLGYLVSVATLSLGFLWVGFDSERRGLHDWLSGTYVVRT
jgi:uncharacterized RDD family membrane protein YckC